MKSVFRAFKHLQSLVLAWMKLHVHHICLKVLRFRLVNPPRVVLDSENIGTGHFSETDDVIDLTINCS